MQVFIIAITLALVVSFICSIFESVLLSLSHAQVELLASQGKPSGRILKAFKERIDIPISAILITNTAAHTIGTAVAGASYAEVFNPETLWIFTLVFTVAVLLFTEIIPKTLGVAYAQKLARPVAFGIRALALVLKPLVLVSEAISRSIRGGNEGPVTSLDEIRLMATIGHSEGVVGKHTAQMIVGASELRKLNASNIMVARRDVVFLSRQLPQPGRPEGALRLPRRLRLARARRVSAEEGLPPRRLRAPLLHLSPDPPAHQPAVSVPPGDRMRQGLRRRCLRR